MIEEPEVVADAPLLPPEEDPFADPAAPSARVHQQPTHTAETAEQRSRRCPFHKTCVCDHTACRDGWLDAEERFEQNGRSYSGVVRCPRCNDARVMHTELAGMRGGRR